MDMVSDKLEFFEYSSRHSNSRANQVLVSTILEKTLHDAGIYQDVITELEKSYNCNLLDCYNRPQYLISTLKDQHPSYYKKIINSINRHLEIFSEEEPVAEFLKIINLPL